jgi:hypothetical protein
MRLDVQAAMRCSFLTLLLAVTAVGCDTFYEVRGRVSRCADQRPIPDAMVHLSDGSRGGFTKTDADGTFRAALNEPDGDGPSQLTVARVGFQTVEQQVTRPHAEQTVCLPSAAP